MVLPLPAFAFPLGFPSCIDPAGSGTICLAGKEKPSHIFVVHGEDSVTDSFAATITDRFGIPAFAPYSGGCVDLATDTILSEGIRLPKKAVEKPAKARALTAFNRVVAAAKHLMDVVLKNEGLANKDLAKFESQIQNLADKWDRDDR